MKLLVTGGTGFVGGHIAAAAVRAGHDVRLLVRRREQVAVTLGPLGVSVTDVLAGDVLDPVAVAKALDGCDAVVHAAAVYSLDVRKAGEVLRTNEHAARLVLSGADAAGLDPVVHISSTVALTRAAGSGADLPLGELATPYARSKISSEIVARELQADGAPVVVVYPGGCLGPHDPYPGDQSERVRWVLLGRMPVWPRGGMHMVDVRTVSEVVTAVLHPGRGPRRYVVPGHHVSGDLFYRTLSDVTGRRLPHLLLPASRLAPGTRAIETLQKRLPANVHLPADHEGVLVLAADTHMDDSPARSELGIEPPPFEDTVRDTVTWLVESGRMKLKYAGRALAAAGPRT